MHLFKKSVSSKLRSEHFVWVMTNVARGFPLIMWCVEQCSRCIIVLYWNEWLTRPSNNKNEQSYGGTQPDAVYSCQCLFIGQVVTKYRDLVTLDFHCRCVSIKSFVPAILGLLPVFSVSLLEPSVLGADSNNESCFQRWKRWWMLPFVWDNGGIRVLTFYLLRRTMFPQLYPS